jgi:hypothetical protein
MTITMPDPDTEVNVSPAPAPACPHTETSVRSLGSGLSALVCTSCPRIVRQLESGTNQAHRVQRAIDLKALLECGKLNAFERGYVTALLGIKKAGPSQYRTIERLKQMHLHGVNTNEKDRNEDDARG